MERKVCADCGQANLETETRCWACGGTGFVPWGTAFAGERTLALGVAMEPTCSWATDRRPTMTLVYLGIAVACAFFMCVVGYWIGRASAGGTRERMAAVPAVSRPVNLPEPPTGGSMVPAPAAATAGGGAAGNPDEPLVVTVRTQVPGRPYAGAVSRPAGAIAAPSFAPSPAIPAPLRPGTLGAARPMLPRRAPVSGSVVTRYPVGDPAAAAPAPAALAPAPAPSASSAVVTLRNDTTNPVEVALDGQSNQTALIGSGSVLPLTLAPGAYHLRATGAGTSSARSSLVLAAGRTYSLVVTARREGGKESLALVEPAIDGG